MLQWPQDAHTRALWPGACPWQALCPRFTCLVLSASPLGPPQILPRGQALCALLGRVCSKGLPRLVVSPGCWSLCGNVPSRRDGEVASTSACDCCPGGPSGQEKADVWQKIKHSPKCVQNLSRASLQPPSQQAPCPAQGQCGDRVDRILHPPLNGPKVESK